jgi:ribonucleoside-triphosphate reductase
MSFIDENGSIADPYRNFIHVSRYSRWLEDKGRRETWVETVDRYINFMRGHLVSNYNYDENNKIFEEVRDYVLNHKVMPSMRAMMTAGPALERDNVAAYNCSFIAVDSLRAFDEAMYILMNGTGVGFSVESKHINNLPVIADEFYPTGTTIVVEDSKLGWSKAYKELISLLVTGQIPNWDVSKVRPAGARLKTFGGRASGPEPLEDLFRFTVETFQTARGRRLKPIEAHDLMCKVGEIVVVGGVRRSALISLSNLDDLRWLRQSQVSGGSQSHKDH